MAKKETKNEQKGTSKYTRWIWRIFFGGLLFTILVFGLAALGVFGKLPSFEELENPESNLATEVISIDGETLGKFYRENRTPVKFAELPDNLIQALVATEDERFYEHSGIDFSNSVDENRRLFVGENPHYISGFYLLFLIAHQSSTSRSSSRVLLRNSQAVDLNHLVLEIAG